MKMLNQKTEAILNKAYEEGVLSGFDFSIFMQNLLISEGGYILNTGKYENVNAEVVLRLIQKKIKKHPWLWRLFFMIA